MYPCKYVYKGRRVLLGQPVGLQCSWTCSRTPGHFMLQNLWTMVESPCLSNLQGLNRLRLFTGLIQNSDSSVKRNACSGASGFYSALSRLASKILGLFLFADEERLVKKAFGLVFNETHFLCTLIWKDPLHSEILTAECRTI